MKKRYIAILCLICFALGWIANRQKCNVEAYWIGFESGQYDGMVNASLADKVHIIPTTE